MLIPLGLRKPTIAVPVPLIPTDATSAALGAAGFHSVSVMSLPSNSGNSYILSNSSPPDTTLYSNVVWALTPGSSFPFGGHGMNPIDVRNLYIGSAVDNEGCLVNVEIV